MTQSDRRQYYRTPCNVILELRSVDKDTLAHGKPSELFNEGEALGLLGNFHQLDKQSAQLARGLAARNSGGDQTALLDYLELLNRKISCLAQTVTAQNPTLAAQAHQQIDLSESGLCFQSQRSYYKDALVAVRIVFLPHYLSVVLFARVVRCENPAHTSNKDHKPNTEKANSDQYHIALEFLQPTESDQQIIAQQVMAAQLSAQRAAKKTSS